MREREREKDREKNVADEQTKHKERERGPQTSGQTRVRSLRAKKPDNNPTPETKNTTQNTQHPSQRNLTKTRYKTNKVSEDLSPQGGGAHGPPLHSWGVTPGDRSTEGYKYPPHYGNRPRWRKKRTHTQHTTNTPKVLSQHLAVPILPNKTTSKQADTKGEQRRHPGKQRRARWQTLSLNTQARRNVARGEPHGGGWAPPPGPDVDMVPT